MQVKWHTLSACFGVKRPMPMDTFIFLATALLDLPSIALTDGYYLRAPKRNLSPKFLVLCSSIAFALLIKCKEI
ncbi:MAG: hypothetical protein ABI045_00950 [Flavobacteriales bacterium]